MKVKDHLGRSGGMGIEIHEFLDRYFLTHGTDHRVILHHKFGIKLVIQRFGPDAAAIAEQHIRDDWFGNLPENCFDREYYRSSWGDNVYRFNEALAIAQKLMRDFKEMS